MIQKLLPPTAAYSTAKGNVLARLWRHYGAYQVADSITEGPVLDLGCNQGELLEELRDKGLEACGVEFSPEAVSWCKNLGLDVVEGSLDDFEIQPGTFRTIVLSHVLEHLAAPCTFLVGSLRVSATKAAWPSAFLISTVRQGVYLGLTGTDGIPPFTWFITTRLPFAQPVNSEGSLLRAP